MSLYFELEHSRENRAGSIEVICGSMFSGKTEELIRRLKRTKIAGQRIKIFKPELDVRYSKFDVVSHDSNALESTPVNGAKEILKLAQNHDVVAIDEAQFFEMDLIEVAENLANKGLRVIIAGLDMDFKGRPFGPIPNLMAIADDVLKVHAICVNCGRPAQFSNRINQNQHMVFLGEMREYEPLCRSCYIKKHELS